MPNGIVPDEGLAAELTAILVNAATEFAAWSLVLFVNDLTPTEDTVWADIEEATFAGYSRRSLTAASWGAPVVAGHVATSTWGAGDQTWTNNSADPVTVYGSAFFDSFSGTLRKVQRFDPEDITAVEPGGTISVTPRFSYRSQLASE